jgi:putative nucleotidyltransferase with HDIG domain
VLKAGLKDADYWLKSRRGCFQVANMPKQGSVSARPTSRLEQGGHGGAEAPRPMPIPPQARLYLAVVIAAGTAALGWSIWTLAGSHLPDRYWLILLALTCFSSTFSIRVPKVPTTISVSETFVFLCALLYGPAAATVVIAVDGLMMSFWRRYSRPIQLLFNIAEPALALFIAGRVFALLAGHETDTRHETTIVDWVGPLAGFALTYFLFVTGMNAGIVALTQRVPLWSVWRPHFGAVLLNYLGSASVAGLLVYNSRAFNFTTLAIVLPLLVISYITFKTALERVEDANRHLEQMNRLYLSTIETLAMAVDATDQITHGHIRRVQSWAVGLARTLGVSDENQIKAIEAAALLHDVGKLAIPEHILNKPGRLSKAEFEKMKRHASIGADILSAIDFPYPVVPIVRHHHEQWDGAGYPDGLSGSEIPVGARILAVVDCFDALTSDRPYRRALSDGQAIDMLLAQRGRAYDPLVVDTFARVFRDIAPADPEPGPRGEALREIAEVSQATPAAPSPPPEVVTEAVPIVDAMLSRVRPPCSEDVAEDVAAALRGATPATLVAFFSHNEDVGCLEVRFASGESADLLAGLRLPLGDRLSGWVGANRVTICNSDGALDFLGAEPPVPFRSCLSVPLIADNALAGVVSLYAHVPSAFSDLHRRTVESAAKPLAHLLRGLREIACVERLSHHGIAATVEPFDPAAACGPAGRPPSAVLSIHLDVKATKETPAAALARAFARIRRVLREGDALYSDGASAMLVLLTHADARAASTLAGRLRERLADQPVIVGVSTAPRDGTDVASLVGAARRRSHLSLCVAGDPAGEDDCAPMIQAHLFQERDASRTGVA